MRKKNRLWHGIANSDIEFPLTLGRDFTGTIISKGHGVCNKLNLRDEVWGVVPVEEQGCHANFVIIDHTLVILYF